MTTAYQDTGKGGAGMEAIKTILDTCYTCFPKGGIWGGGGFNLCDHG